MKQIIKILAILLLVSCHQTIERDELIYDEYITSYLKAYKKTRSEIRIDELLFSVNDTLKFYESDYLYLNKDIITDYDYDAIPIQKNSEWIISNIEGKWHYLRSVNDTSIKGYISKMELEFQFWGLAQNKWLFYEKQRENILMFIDSIQSKHNISEKDFYEIMAKEHFQRTGERFFHIEY